MNMDLNANLVVKNDKEVDRFLEFVKGLPGVQVLSGPVPHALNTQSRAWFNVRSDFLDEEALAETLQKDGDFDVEVFNPDKHEPMGHYNGQHMAAE